VTSPGSEQSGTLRNKLMVNVTVIRDGKNKKVCELCGAVKELRPYGPGGKFICFDCAMKNLKETKKQCGKIFKKGITIIDATGE
jgi:hypothetical protein